MVIGYTQSQVDDLRIAIVAFATSGVLTVKYSGPPAREMTYRNLEEMKALLVEMIADIAEAAGTRTAYRFAAHRKGFNCG